MVKPKDLKKTYSIDLHKIFIRPQTPSVLLKVTNITDKIGEPLKCVKGEKLDI